MKKLIFSLLVLASSAPLVSQAQSEKTIPERPNIVKLNVTPLIYRTISLQYERLLGAHTSVALGINLMPKGGIPFLSAFENSLQDSVDASVFNAKMSVINFAPEFRYYFKEAGKGFYVAPYMKYRIVNAAIPINYIDDNSQSQTIGLNGKLNTLMLGVMVGSQFRLSDQISLDWFIAGGHLSSNKVNYNFTTSQTLSAADQQDLKDSFEELKQSTNRLKNIEYSVNSNSGSVKGNFSGFSFRGAGLCLGYRF